MKHVFIVNPVAGKRNAATGLVPQIITAAAEAGAEHEVLLTERPGHAAEIARSFAVRGEEVRLYACGGDGTLHEVLQGALGYENAAVGCVPCGSGNDFARNFGKASEFRDLPALLAGEVIPIDLIDTPHGFAASTCSMGLDAQVASGIDHWRRIPGCGGSVSYLLSAAQALHGPLGHRLRVTIDGRTQEDDFLLAAICNGVAYGGGFRAAPDARVNDGLLDVILVKKMELLRIAPLLAAYRAGGHLQNGAVAPGFEEVLTFTRAKAVAVEAVGSPIMVNVDGECCARQRLEARCVSHAGNIVLPRGLRERYLGI